MWFGSRWRAGHVDALSGSPAKGGPKAVGDFLMLDALRASGGGVVAVTDEEMLASVRELGTAEGIFAATEGAACHAALKKLKADRVIAAEEQVVLFNTGAGVKYLECFDGL